METWQIVTSGLVIGGAALFNWKNHTHRALRPIPGGASLVSERVALWEALRARLASDRCALATAKLDELFPLLLGEVEAP